MELKPCPFCGLPAKMHTTYYPSEYVDSDDNIPADAAIIREWRKPKAREWTADKYGVAKKTIMNAIKGVTWKCVPYFPPAPKEE